MMGFYSSFSLAYQVYSLFCFVVISNVQYLIVLKFFNLGRPNLSRSAKPLSQHKSNKEISGTFVVNPEQRWIDVNVVEW